MTCYHRFCHWGRSQSLSFAAGAEASRYRLPPGPKPVVVLSFATGAEASNHYHRLPLGPKPVVIAVRSFTVRYHCLSPAVCPPSLSLDFPPLSFIPVAISFALVFLVFVATRCFASIVAHHFRCHTHSCTHPFSTHHLLVASRRIMLPENLLSKLEELT